MVHTIRKTICSKILYSLQINGDKCANDLIKLNAALQFRGDSHKPELHLSLNEVSKIFNRTVDVNELKRTNEIDANVISTSQPTANKLIFQIDKPYVMKQTLEQKEHLYTGNEKNVIVEFSSPNIAKPFHVGHLRSTIIGNFIANLYKRMHHKVHRINYLGDWGTQFGYLKLGMDRAKCSDEDIKYNPIRILFDAYVRANKLGESDVTIAEQARNIFCQLENDKYDELEQWNLYRKYTVEELRKMYHRLGVEFDEYCWESQYRKKNILKLLEVMKDNLVVEDDGKQVICVGDRRVPIVKSDGTTLYLTRDIAALLERSRKHQFDEIFYVVDNGQHDHFNLLFQIGKQLLIPGIHGAKHIKFGRIKNMSTRKGNVVFLNDILDEAKDIMLQKQHDSPTTKVDVLDSNTNDILGISAVLINDLKQKRLRDYEFDWEKVLQVNGDTGIRLQYTHCRLCNLEDVTKISPAFTYDPKLLCEEEAEQLIYEIAKYPDCLYRCLSTLESCYLVNYLFSLSHSIGRALKTLNIKDHPDRKVQEQRMLLFVRARQTLNEGMQILGLRPLNKM